MRNFVLHMKKGNLLITEADAIAEAERQEKKRNFSDLFMA